MAHLSDLSGPPPMSTVDFHADSLRFDSMLTDGQPGGGSHGQSRRPAPVPPVLPAVVPPDPRAAALAHRSAHHAGGPQALTAVFVAHLESLIPPGRVALALTPPTACRLLEALLDDVWLVADPLVPDGPDRAAHQLIELGTWMRESGLGVEDQQAIGFALVRAVRDLGSAPWSTQVGSAWASVQGWLVGHLMAGALRVPDEPRWDDPSLPDRGQEPGRRAGGAAGAAGVAAESAQDDFAPRDELMGRLAGGFGRRR